jgi:large subunit ribosomal protein L13e
LSEEGFQQNVQRLVQYKSKLVLFPRVRGKPKKGEINDASKEQLKNVQQLKGDVLPHVQKFDMPEPREIKPEERKKKAFKIIRKARREAREVGYQVKKKLQAKEKKDDKKKK